MQKSLKILLISAAVLIFLTVAGIGMFLLQFDANRYREDLTALVEKQTGREFSIQGDIYLAASLLPTLAVEQATLGNADWAREPVMLSVGRLETRIALLPLLHGEIAIRRIILLQPVANLEIGEAGTGNWLFSTAGDDDGTRETGRSEGLPAIDIRELQIEEATITYLGAGQDQPTVFRIDHLSAAPEGFGESLQVELTATFEDLPVSLSGTTGSLAQFTAGTPYPLSLAAKAGAAEGSIEGRIENPLALTGINITLQLQADSLADFNPYTSQHLPDKGPVELSASVTGDPSDLDIAGLKVVLADTTVQGHAAFSSGSERPAVAMDLTADHINLVPYQPQEEDEKQKDKKIFSSQKIDLAGLRAVDADISLKAARFLTRDANFRDLELKTTLNRGDLRVQSAGGIAGGSLDSDIRFNAAGGTPLFNARLDIKNLLPEQLPALQEDPVIREGRTDIHFEGRGAGPSPAAIAASLNGRLLVTTGKGRLLNKATRFAGADVIFSTFRMLNPLAEKEEDSELICGVLNFDIKDGMAQAKNGIALQTSKVNVLGSGAVDLKTEAIDFRAKPKAREGVGINLAQLGDAVYIGGTLANPRPATDVKGVLKTAGTVGTAMATGGLSLLAQGLFSRAFSTDDPCGVALGKKAAGGREARQQDTSAAGDQKDDKSTLERAGDKVKGAFDSLFGK